MPRTRPLVIGHRGAPGYRPEHSRSSYDLALAMGVDAVEPDVVVSQRRRARRAARERDLGNDRCRRPSEFADRRTTKTIDGAELTGWFTEDFTWDELSTLRCRERLPKLRPASASFDDEQPVLRLRDVLDLVRAASLEQGRELGVVLEIKHATYFAGLGWDVADLIDAELRDAGWARGELPLTSRRSSRPCCAAARARHPRRRTSICSRPPVARSTSSRPSARLRRRTAQTAARGPGRAGRRRGRHQRRQAHDPRARQARPHRPGRRPLVADAHARGLRVFTWTCRPENTFLVGQFRGRGGAAAFGDYEAEWAVIRDAGIDGVFVDHADLGVDFFRG